MKIRKYQYGGDYIPVTRDPIQQAQTSAPASSSPQKSEDNLIDKEIMKVLGENGIPSDVDRFLSQAQSFLSSSLNTYSGGGFGNSISKLIRLRGLANRIRYNNELATSAHNRMKTENTGSDYALSDDGRVYVLGEEGLEKVSISELNDGEYQPLTNYDLLYLRERNPVNEDGELIAGDLSFNEDILHDISNSVGMQTVMEQVIGTIKKFGTSSQKGYTTKSGVAQGLEYLMNGPTEHYTVETENPKLADNIESAVKYLYSNLTTNAKNVLRVQAAVNGTTTTDILLTAFEAHTNRSVKVDPIEDPNAGSGKSGSTTTGLEDQTGYGQAIASGYGAARVRQIRTREGKTQMIQNVKHNPIKDSSGENMVGIATLDEVYNAFAKHGLSTDRSRIYFGDLSIDPNKSREIIVDASQGVEVWDVPVRADGSPDFDAINRFEDAEQEIRTNNITEPTEKLRIYRKYFLDANLDQNGNLMTNKFLVVSGKMSEDEGALYGYETNNQTIDRLTGQGRQQFKNDVNYSNQAREKKNKIDINYGWIWNRGVLSSQILIPLYVNQMEFALQDKRARTLKRPGTEYQMMQETRVDPTYYAGGYNPTRQTLNTNFEDL